MKQFKKIISTLTICLFVFNMLSSPSEACFYRRPWTYGSQGTTRINVVQKPKTPPNTGERNQSAPLDPVYLHNGEFVYDKKVLFIPSRGLNIEIVHRYNSQSLHNSRFGYGWDTNYNKRIIALSNGDLLYLDGENRRYRLKYVDGAEYINPSQLYDKVTQNGDGTYTLTKKDGIKYNFNQNGCLVELIDRSLNRVSFTYDSRGRVPLIGISPFSADTNPKVIAYDYILAAITDAAGRTVNFEYNADGRLAKITDFAGRVISYTYNTVGDLVAITMPQTTDYPDGVATIYTYTNHNLEAITDPKGQLFLTNHYDLNDRVDWQIYGIDKSTISYISPNQTMVTDPSGNKAIYTFNNNGNPMLKEERNASDTVSYKTFYEYNSAMELTKVTYPNGNSIEYKYESQLAEVKTWEFNSDGNAEGWIRRNGIDWFGVLGGVLKFSICYYWKDARIENYTVGVDTNKNQDSSSGTSRRA